MVQKSKRNIGSVLANKLHKYEIGQQIHYCPCGWVSYAIVKDPVLMACPKCKKEGQLPSFTNAKDGPVFNPPPASL